MNNDDALRYPTGKFTPKDSYTLDEINLNISRIESLPAKVEEAFKNLSAAETILSKNHLIRLLTFVPGILFYDADATENLLYEAGSYIAQIENHLKVRIFI